MAGNAAAFQLLGSRPEAVWLLTDTQLAKQCEQRGVEKEGSREEQLARLSSALRGNEGGRYITYDRYSTNDRYIHHDRYIGAPRQ